jgi:hypothetical protein
VYNVRFGEPGYIDNTYKKRYFCTYGEKIMETKLTLKMEKKVIHTAKMYAKRNNRSLSKIVENYFMNLSPEHNFSKKHSPVVERLSGILSGDDLEKIADEDERARYILRKEI